MPRWFDQCVEQRRCAGLILVPDKLPIRDVIEAHDHFYQTNWKTAVHEGPSQETGTRLPKSHETRDASQEAARADYCLPV